MKKKKESLDENYDTAYDFATKCYKKFRDVVKSIVLFGSVSKKQTTEKSDIDLVIIIDDCTVNWDDELISWYREELAKLLSEQKYKKEIHINTVTLSAFWEEVRAGEPLIINIIRYGEALIDLGGFFDPLKILLAKGRIRPTPEAIFTSMQRSGSHLGRANNNILNSIEGFYWAMVDASHAALMAFNVTPPSPENISELLTENFVNKKIIGKEYIMWFEQVKKRAKDILHGDIKKLNGKELEELQRKSESFVYNLNELTKSIIRDKKIINAVVKKI